MGFFIVLTKSVSKVVRLVSKDISMDSMTTSFCFICKICLVIFAWKDNVKNAKSGYKSYWRIISHLSWIEVVQSYRNILSQTHYVWTNWTNIFIEASNIVPQIQDIIRNWMDLYIKGSNILRCLRTQFILWRELEYCQ